MKTLGCESLAAFLKQSAAIVWPGWVGGGVVLFLLDRPRILPFVLSFPDLLSASSCPVVETVRSCKKSQSPSLIVSTLLEDKVGG